MKAVTAMADYMVQSTLATSLAEAMTAFLSLAMILNLNPCALIRTSIPVWVAPHSLSQEILATGDPHSCLLQLAGKQWGSYEMECISWGTLIHPGQPAPATIACMIMQILELEKLGGDGYSAEKEGALLCPTSSTNCALKSQTWTYWTVCFLSWPCGLNYRAHTLWKSKWERRLLLFNILRSLLTM